MTPAVPSVRRWLAEHADPDCCDIVTTGHRTGDPHEIEIWSGVSDATMYLISGSGPTADWYRNLLARPEVRVTIGHDQRAGHGRDVTDPAERRLVGDLMGAKYVGRRPRQRAHPPGVVLRRAAAAIEFDAP